MRGEEKDTNKIKPIRDRLKITQLNNMTMVSINNIVSVKKKEQLLIAYLL